jgi:hypothetical protein
MPSPRAALIAIVILSGRATGKALSESTVNQIEADAGAGD